MYRPDSLLFVKGTSSICLPSGMEVAVWEPAFLKRFPPSIKQLEIPNVCSVGVTSSGLLLYMDSEVEAKSVPMTEEESEVMLDKVASWLSSEVGKRWVKRFDAWSSDVLVEADMNVFVENVEASMKSDWEKELLSLRAGDVSPPCRGSI